MAVAGSWAALAAFVAVNFAAASSGAIFKPGLWYEGLSKPSWTPPNWAFPVVWATLFCMIAASGWLVWRAAGWSAWPAFAAYGANLALNAGWSALFLGRRRLDWALVDAVALLASIGLVMALFAPISPLAAALLIPYFLWVAVANLLNLRMLQLNGATGAGA
ncbi:MAG: TspO/MBR family protein [Pseudomonadota bacterium]